MRSQPGQIISISSSAAIVRLQPVPSCPRCAAGQGCGAGIVAQLRGDDVTAGRQIELDASLLSGRQVGDLVTLEMPGTTLLQVSALAYGVPLVAMLVSVALGAWWWPQGPEYVHLLAAGLGLAGGLAYARRWSVAHSRLCRMQPAPAEPGAQDATTNG